ncbi:MAG TPA: hypothetical protein VKT77_08525 [Chthonomonadaceae bacterium]|nr:hypothetical protein [Chthonomonadaceae bacterium]
MWRYLNMFVLIGVALVAISIAGFATGSRFLTEPGQALNPQGSWIYLGAGVIMLINGYVSIKQADALRQQREKSKGAVPDREEPAAKRAVDA